MKKKNDNEVFWKVIFPALIFIVALIAYLAVPSVNAFFFKISAGWLGLVILLGLGALLFLWYNMLYHLKGKTLLYVIGVILFTIFCIWMIANHELVFSALEAALGTWGMIGTLIVFCIILYVVMQILF
jgi:hypothetical protein